MDNDYIKDFVKYMICASADDMTAIPAIAVVCTAIEIYCVCTGVDMVDFVDAMKDATVKAREDAMI